MTPNLANPSSSTALPNPPEPGTRPAKRLKMDDVDQSKAIESFYHVTDYRENQKKGIAPIKAEFLLHSEDATKAQTTSHDDDAEQKTFMSSGVKASYGTPRRADPQERENGKSIGESEEQPEDNRNGPNSRGRGKKERGKKKDGGQNKNRMFGHWGDKLQLCPSRQLFPEFSPRECRFGGKCKFEHDLRKYLSEGKSEDLTTFEGVCPVWKEKGFCPAGWKCRFVGSHSKEIDTEDGKKELVLVENENRKAEADVGADDEGADKSIYNLVSTKTKIDLERKRVKTIKADKYTQWLTESWNPQQVRVNNNFKEATHIHRDFNKSHDNATKVGSAANDIETEVNVETKHLDAESGTADEQASKHTTEQQDEAEAVMDKDVKQDHRASYKDPPYRPSEKRRLYYGADTPVLAPLTTQGNLPFRRLCVELGAQITWSEMAMGLPIVQGQKGEWALVKAHESEITPPKIKNPNVVVDYDNKVDMKFGVQIAANKPWIALKTTEVLATYCSHLRAIDLNCGCPIDLVFDSGAGSALLNSVPKLEKILRGMNVVSNEIPITCKIRTGVKDSSPNAGSLAERLVMGGQTAQNEGLGPCGVAALTLHGRSRQQRYTKLANWEYIADVAALIKDLKAKQGDLTDTVREADPRDQPNGGKVYFIGNGDVLSHVDYNEHIENAGVDSVMIARGALIKPWIFEEIASNQYLDKSATERLEYIEKFCKYGMATWGSDETGIGTTRKFLLEWLSFQRRYIPLGLLEVLPPKINERPPPYKGRNELETLLASDDYQDWIKISEMFLGPAHEGFKFTPKHKSNSYDAIEAEG